MDGQLVQDALNGVGPDQRTNLKLWNVLLGEYGNEMLEELNMADEKLRKRIESHLVSNEELESTRGAVQLR